MPANGPKVVADTSVLQYLFQVGTLHLLPALFQQIVVPDAVAQELAEGRRLDVSVPDPSAYDWMRIYHVEDVSLLPTLSHLGAGEREAIALARQWPRSLLLIDDGRARRHASDLGTRCTGTLGVLISGKSLGLIAAVKPYVELLEEHGFRLAPRTRAHVLSMAGE